MTVPRKGHSVVSSEAISALVRQLGEIERKLQALTGGPLGSVALPTGQSQLLDQLLTQARQNEESRNQVAILNALPAHIALLDAEGVIISVNESWQKFASNNVLQAPSYGVGQNYLQVCREAEGECAEDAHTVATGIQAVLEGNERSFSHEYPCHSLSEERWFRLMASPLDADRPGGAVVMHINVTERKLAADALYASEASMAAAQLIAHFGSWELELADPAGTDANRLRWSNEMFRIAGFEPGAVEVSNELFFKLVPEAEHASIRQAVADAIRDHRPYSIFHTLIRPNGDRRIVHEAAQVFFDSRSGKPLKMIGTAHDVTEQRSLTLLLETERTRLVAAQAVAKVGSWETDLATLEVIWSAETYRIFEVDPVGFRPTHQAFLDFVHPDDRAAVAAAFQASLNRSEGSSIEHRIVLAGGKSKFVEERWRSSFDPQGRPVRCLGTCQDITERKRIEERISKSEQEFRTLAESVPQIIWVTRADGWNIFFNQRWVDYTGLTLAESLGHGWNKPFHPDDRQRAWEAWQEATKTSGTYSLECRLRRADGIYRWWLIRGVPMRDEAGQILKWFGTCTDIDDLKTAEARISEQAALIDEASDAIIVRDMDNRITFWSRGSERIYGWTFPEAKGRVAPELLQADSETFSQADRAIREVGQWKGEIQKRTKKGNVIMLDCRWTLMRDELGDARSILSIDTDITERKKLEAQFLRAQRMESIGTLAGGIAHDLNNVLSPILMAVQLLKENAADEQSQALLATMQSCTQRGADLVKQVLSFARGVEGERITVNPVHILRDLNKMIQDTFPKNIDFSFKASRDLWTITGDPTQLYQVFMNLCVNARDAMHDGGKLEITAENAVLDEVYAGMNPEARPGAFVVVKVEDTGMGIPRAIRDKIFEPFFTTKEVGKGTGLGLSTTLAIVRSHDGFIHLYSEPGKGTKFKIYLPANTAAAAAETQALEPTKLPLGNHELILVVDDEAGIREIAKRTLERYGYRVLLAANGAEAVAIYAQQQHDIDLVLTDMAMPIMDGPAEILALRTINPDVKIIASSGLASQGGVAKAVGAGVRHFIPKPYTADKMLTIIAEALKDSTQP